MRDLMDCLWQLKNLRVPKITGMDHIIKKCWFLEKFLFGAEKHVYLWHKGHCWVWIRMFSYLSWQINISFSPFVKIRTIFTITFTMSFQSLALKGHRELWGLALPSPWCDVVSSQLWHCVPAWLASQPLFPLSISCIPKPGLPGFG